MALWFRFTLYGYACVLCIVSSGCCEFVIPNPVTCLEERILQHYTVVHKNWTLHNR